MTAQIVPISRNKRRFYLHDEYALGYMALTIASSEERVLGAALRKAIRRSNTRYGALLDIGAADGRLTKRIGSRFKRVSVYEPNSVLFSMCMSALSEWQERLTAHNSTFPDTTFRDRKYDVILASHVLYHLEPDRWKEFFLNARARMAPNARLILVLWNSESDARRYAQNVEPDRWLCDAESLLGPNSIFSVEESGFSVTEVEEVTPIVKAYSEEMASLITHFLIGNSARADNESVEQLREALLVHGIRNSQSIIVLKSSSDD